MSHRISNFSWTDVPAIDVEHGRVLDPLDLTDAFIHLTLSSVRFRSSPKEMESFL